MKRLVIGILAHVDSGKTTLSESILYRAGEIRKLGRVDHGDAFLDTHEIERDRGITIFAKQAVLSHGDCEITLLDTPGHVDFSTEMERTLQVLDYAILVISGSDGVQSHTETLWKLLIRYNIPVFIFVNKMDLTGTDKENVLNELKTKLSDGCMDFCGDCQSEEFCENLAMCDDDLMNEFLETGKLSNELIAKAVCERKIFPCYFGSALKLDGVDDFLDGIDKYTKQPSYANEFGAKVFKISEDERGARLTHLKITGGTLKVKDLLKSKDGCRDEWAEKVNQIRIYSGVKFQTADSADSGMVCAVTGLSHTYAGEGLGAENDSDIPVLEPVLTYQVNIKDGTNVHTALANLKKLEEEEPQLHIIWNEQLQEIHMQFMGEVQLDILKRIIENRYQMIVEFGQGSIAYKETISAPVEGIGHYEPLRHYAEVHLLLEPLERGSGIKFASNCSEDELDRNWQRLILTHLEEKNHVGVLTGSPITDIKITLVAGRAHQKHTEGGDFRQATYRAVRQGLMTAESVLLEPWYEFHLEIPTENIGRAMTDIQHMGGKFAQPETKGDMSVLLGKAPVSQMRDYHKVVTEYTRGKGRLICMVGGYEECHNADEVIESIGYDSEADLDNTADSVFCSHGSGFVVKWDEVPNYMHVDSGLNFDEDEDETPQEIEHKVRKYLDNVATDNELAQIFERTYGPIKQKLHSAMHTRKNPIGQQKKTAKSKPIPLGPEYLLVDGYNIIFAWENLKNIAKDSLESARTELINILCNYQGFKQCKLILVFDAYKVKGNKGEVEQFHNITVVYTKEAETADMYIEKVTHEIGRKHRVRVATSDNLEQIIILGNGAIRVSADSFRKEVEDIENTIRKFLN